MTKCKNCTKKQICPRCVLNPLNSYEKELLKTYLPNCPKGFQNCTAMAAFLQKNYPEWYRELYEERNH